jgi:hypothetical protein
MPEISQEELDALRAAAAKADSPAPDAEVQAPLITQEELDALRAKAALADKAPAAAEEERERVPGVDAKPGFDDDAPPAPTFRAYLANGQTYDYSGAHPTHVAVGKVLVPVSSVLALDAAEATQEPADKPAKEPAKEPAKASKKFSVRVST